jgi:long-chain acyl-CoA synthetase
MSLATVTIERSRRAELALADEDVSYSWDELDPILNRATNALLSMHPPIRRIAVCALNSVETAIAYTAALQAGISSTPTSFHFKSNEITYILNDSGSSVLFLCPETMEVGLAAASAAELEVVVIGWRCPATPGLIHWEDWLAATSQDEPPVDMRPAPHLHYTSGTTGKPKPAETPPGQFPSVATVAELAENLHSRLLPSPGLVIGPNYHAGPLTTIRGLLGGGAVVLLQSFDAEKVLAAISRYSIAATVMVPTHFQRLLELPAEIRAKYDISSMKRLSHTGAACPPGVKRQMIEWFGPVLFEAYGGTEVGITHMIDSHEWLRKPGSVGKSIPPFETLVLDEHGRTLGPKEIGQIYFSDASGRGIVYHNDPQKTAQAHIAPGVCTLGEVGYVDEDGYLFITDRVSDMIVSGGVNIYPAESEQVLITHPKVADVAVIGAPNAQMGEEVKALIVPVNLRDPPTSDELNQLCRQSLAGYKCPRSYEMVEDIGRSAMGKVNKRALRQRYWPTERTIGGG